MQRVRNGSRPMLIAGCCAWTVLAAGFNLLFILLWFCQASIVDTASSPNWLQVAMYQFGRLYVLYTVQYLKIPLIDQLNKRSCNLPVRSEQNTGMIGLSISVSTWIKIQSLPRRTTRLSASSEGSYGNDPGHKANRHRWKLASLYIHKHFRSNCSEVSSSLLCKAMSITMNLLLKYFFDGQGNILLDAIPRAQKHPENTWTTQG